MQLCSLTQARAVTPGISAPAALVKAIASVREGGTRREKLLAEVQGGFFKTCAAAGEHPVVFIDEANEAF